MGAFTLVFAGTGAVMVDSLSSERVGQVGIGLTFGLVVMAMIYATGHISGAHMNPAVTLGFALARHFPWRRVPAYWAAQLVGAVLASLTLRGLLGTVAHMGATLPSGGVAQSFGFEAAMTFFLMFVIMAVATDVRAVGQAAAIAIGGTVALEAIFGGPISGASMNPARSFGPALVSGMWRDRWLYWVAPAVGATAAALLYTWLRSKENALASGATPPDREPPPAK